MPPDNMAINMRRSKLTASEAALLAGELNKPSWESRNEGIHERVSFEDAIWGFDLAGGAYYHTPLRVVGVKPGSRAEKAGIRPGDRLKRINDIDTSTLTIQEAHKIIIESGIHLKIAVTAPEDEEDAYYCYQDEIEDGYDSEEERRLEEEKAKKREVHAKVNSYWSLQWPWVSKRRVIYRESNCFMVPSKFEEKHKDKFSPQPSIRTESDIVLDGIKTEMEAKIKDNKVKDNKISNQVNGNVNPLKDESKAIPNGDVGKTSNVIINGNANGTSKNGILNGIPEIEEDLVQEITDEEIKSFEEELIDEISQNEEVNESEKDCSQIDVSVDDSIAESSDMADSIVENSEKIDSKSEEEVQEEAAHEDDEIFNEVLSIEDELYKGDEENIIDAILSDHKDVNSQFDER